MQDDRLHRINRAVGIPHLRYYTGWASQLRAFASGSVNVESFGLQFSIEALETIIGRLQSCLGVVSLLGCERYTAMCA
jgi:hypothetical protein